MKALRLARFIVAAIRQRNAYVDLDGCLLKRFVVPYYVKGAEARLAYWMANLAPTPIVKRRLCMLYLLRMLGVRLHIWTNRSAQHHKITLIALGEHMQLFDEVYFLGGKKDQLPRLGPCIDDQAKYCTSANDYCVTTK